MSANRLARIIRKRSMTMFTSGVVARNLQGGPMLNLAPLRVILSCHAHECSVLWSQSQIRIDIKGGTYVTWNSTKYSNRKQTGFVVAYIMIECIGTIIQILLSYAAMSISETPEFCSRKNINNAQTISYILRKLSIITHILRDI